MKRKDREARCGRHFQISGSGGLWHQCQGHIDGCCVCGCGVRELTPESRSDSEPLPAEVDMR